MERLTVVGHLTPDEVYQRYRDCPDGRVQSRWHALWLMARPDGRMAAEQAAKVVGLSDVWVRKLVHRYIAGGPDALADGRAKNRSAPKLDAARQADLFAALKAEPADGGLWTGPKVALYASDRWGARVHPNTGWKWLRKLGFRLKVPRPRHPRAASADEQRRWQRRPAAGGR